MPKRSESDKALPRFDLKAAREAKGMTQADAAEFFSSSQPSIARWEADGNLPALHRKYWDLYWKHHPGRKSIKKAAAKQSAHVTK